MDIDMDTDMDTSHEKPNLDPELQPKHFYIGCAGWSIPKEHAAQFPGEEDAESTGQLSGHLSHLERYALRLPAVEINSSFYRSHQPGTYARWAASTPEHFRFSVKIPRQITHGNRLQGTEELLAQFLAEVEALGPKLGPLLVQLPPSLGFEAPVAAAFFQDLRARFDGSVVCEPRHPTWFGAEAEQLLQQFRIARVAADPPVPVPEAVHPGGWGGLVYYRLHGSPRTYYSAYSEEYLAALAETLKTAQMTTQMPATSEQTDAIDTSSSIPKEIWCIFDNTALGAATANVLSLSDRL
jgi:uncharacterized protein YecE (DUF72 family)